MKATDYKASEARKIIVYGAPKTGKTELVGTLAAKFKLWWFSFDNGFKTLTSNNSATKPFLQNIELFDIPDSQLNPVGVETMLGVLRPGAHKICNAHGRISCPLCKDPATVSLFDWSKLDVHKDVVVFDHMTQVMDSCINYIHRKALQLDNWDGIKSSYDDWAKQGAISDRIGSTLQNAPYNSVVISHEVLTELEDGTKKIAPVGGTRNKSSDFGRYFDDIIYTEIVNGEFKAHSTAKDKTRVVVGNRAGIKLQEGKERASLLPLFA
jgi:hypothetical protein